VTVDARGIKATFERDGVYLARGVFDAATIDRLEADFDRIVTQLASSAEDIDATWATAGRSDPSQVVLHTHNVQNYSPRWLAALLDPGLLDVAEAVLGPDIVLHHTKLFQKPRGAGSPFPMHQDWRYFPTSGDQMIAAIIHVSPATEAMGCVAAYPGSHRLGRLPSSSGQSRFDDADEYRQFSDRYDLAGATVYEAEPGDVLLFSALTIHGSGPNVSSMTRKTVLVQLYSGRAELEEADHPVAGLVLRGWNHHATRESVARAATEN
jgi:ectoine hydroxylase-related dioxygenase (phytanoyl-CoA dioxygenase family)